MEYVFGTRERNGVTVERVMTKGDTHSDLSGRISVERDFSDCIIKDVFTVVGKYSSKEDPEGKCYDWYEISDHYRTEDFYGKGIVGVETKIEDTQTGLMEAYDLAADNTTLIEDCNNAIMELYEMLINEEG